MSITKETIYDPILVIVAYNVEQEWHKSLGLNDGEQANKVMLFIIKDNKIKSTKLIERNSVIKYKPHKNEYYLDRVRDTEDIVLDYNLAPAQKLVNLYGNTR